MTRLARLTLIWNAVLLLAGGGDIVKAALTTPLGPTLHLDYGTGSLSPNPVANFMYFVALLSPEPVSLASSPGNSQRVRMRSLARRATWASSWVSDSRCAMEPQAAAPVPAVGAAPEHAA